MTNEARSNRSRKSERTKTKLGINRGINHRLFNKHRSKSTTDKISKNHHNVSGENNPNAKKYILISPNNNNFIVHGGIKKFCKENNISHYAIKTNINKGKIKLKIRKDCSVEFLNAQNWEIKLI